VHWTRDKVSHSLFASRVELALCTGLRSELLRLPRHMLVHEPREDVGGWWWLLALVGRLHTLEAFAENGLLWWHSLAT
jgi:hypothetical protein